MTDLEHQIKELKTLLPQFSGSDLNFASSLIASFEKYGSLTPKQAPWIGKMIDRAKTPAAAKQEPAGFQLPNAQNLFALLDKAGQTLKHPGVNLRVAGMDLYMYKSGPKSKVPGAINLVQKHEGPADVWCGRLLTSGAWCASKKLSADQQDMLIDILQEMAVDPAAVASKYGQLTGRCCFCGMKLSDEHSTAVGYGRHCAKNYGLLEQWKAAQKVLA